MKGVSLQKTFRCPVIASAPVLVLLQFYKAQHSYSKNRFKIVQEKCMVRTPEQVVKIRNIETVPLIMNQYEQKCKLIAA